MLPHTPRQWAGAIAYAILELFLGLTKRTAANSVLELLWVLAHSVCTRLYRRINKNKEKTP